MAFKRLWLALKEGRGGPRWKKEPWECSECGAELDEASHRWGPDRLANPYNANQKTCGPACARTRKTRRQRERREEARQ